MAQGRLNCVSLFSGCGGLDLGLERSGFRFVLATDLDPICAESHARNFPQVPFLTGSIRDLNERQIKGVLGRMPQIDLLAGGPPCRSFSKSRFYRTEKPRGIDDPNGEETVNGYLRILRRLRPRAFILENVKGLTYGVHRKALDKITGVADALGYAVVWTVLNAADFGIPQIRERCFVVGTLDGVFHFPNPTHAKDPPGGSGLKPWVTAGAVLHDLDTKANASDVGHFAGGKHHDLLKLVPPGDNYLFFTKERGHQKPKFVWRSRYWSFLLKLSPRLPSWTIQARRSNNMGPLHWRNRILRIEEIKRLQTFPDDFYLAGNVEAQWRQVGNAVPPALARILGRALLEHLRRGARLAEAA